MHFFHRTIRSIKAQSATELAIFGSVLLFIIGLIVRQGLRGDTVQDSQLKAMRLAMRQSYLYSEGLAPELTEYSTDGWVTRDGVASRNSSTIIFVEDRLTASADKFAAIDRVPYIVSGSGSHSRNMFMPTDPGEDVNLPIVDLFINGQHYPLTTAGFKRVCFAKSSNSVNLDRIRACGVPRIDYDEWMCDNPVTASMCDDSGPEYPYWKDDCITQEYTTGPGVTAFRDFGCAKLYTTVPNHPGVKDWCDHDGLPNGPNDKSCDDNVPVATRFDLDRNGTPDVDPIGANPLGIDWSTFSWQWKVVMAFKQKHRDKNPLNFGEGMNVDKQFNVSADVDNDLKEENIMEIVKASNNGIIGVVYVLDFQEGDLNLSPDENVPVDGGLSNDVEMFSMLSRNDAPKTEYVVEQGGDRFVKDSNGVGIDGFISRSVLKKEQLDIISRKINLSRNTGRFCENVGGAWRVTQDRSDSTKHTVGGIPRGIPNPVDVCVTVPSDCTNIEANRGLNCMYVGRDTLPITDVNYYPFIYVRSQVYGGQGRSWITQTGADDYIDFATEE